MSQFNENMRRRCQHELNQKLSQIDCQNNKIFQMEQNRQLYMMKYEVLEEQFTLLFNSIETISNAKNLEDKYDLKIESLENQIKEQSSENKMLETYVRETTADRDNYRKHTNQLINEKNKLEKEKTTQMETFKKRLMELDRDMKQRGEELNESQEAKLYLEKEKKHLIAEREKMKDRIKKLKQRKGKFDVASKVCKNCGKDYIEKENFNWSCRVHRSEWSGEIWWCCGKDSKD